MEHNNYYPQMEYPPNSTETQVCHDFQNGHCNRISCKYLHILRGAAAPYYNPRGFRPYPQLSNVPPCKDFLNGHCRREKCRYRHISKAELNIENSFRQDAFPRPPLSYGVPEIESTKRHYDDLLYEKSQRVSLLEENIHLRSRVTQIEQQIADLRATNNLLMEQISEYKGMCTNSIGGVLTTPNVVYQPLLSIITSTPGYPNCCSNPSSESLHWSAEQSTNRGRSFEIKPHISGMESIYPPSVEWSQIYPSEVRPHFTGVESHTKPFGVCSAEVRPRLSGVETAVNSVRPRFSVVETYTINPPVGSYSANARLPLSDAEKISSPVGNLPSQVINTLNSLCTEASYKDGQKIECGAEEQKLDALYIQSASELEANLSSLEEQQAEHLISKVSQANELATVDGAVREQVRLIPSGLDLAESVVYEEGLNYGGECNESA